MVDGIVGIIKESLLKQIKGGGVRENLFVGDRGS